MKATKIIMWCIALCVTNHVSAQTASSPDTTDDNIPPFKKMFLGEEICDTSDGVIRTDRYNGDKYFDVENKAGALVDLGKFTLLAGERAGPADRITIRYANGLSESLQMQLQVKLYNDTRHIINLDFPPTGAWSEWREETFSFGDYVDYFDQLTLTGLSEQGGPHIAWAEFARDLICTSDSPCYGSGGAFYCSPAPVVEDELCTVDYNVTNSWGNIYQVNLSITNMTNEPIEGYTLSWNLGQEQELIAGWNATFESQLSEVSASNPADAWNGTIAANSGKVSFGLQVVSLSTPIPPQTFGLNEGYCSLNDDSSQMCNWHGWHVPICQNITEGWAQENGQACIGVNTCGDRVEQ